MKNERMLDLSLLGENNHRQLFSNTSVVVVVQSISASAINSFHRRRAGQIFVKSEEAKSLVDVSRLTFWSLSAYAVSYRFMSDLRRAFYTRQCSLIWSYVNWRIESNSLRLRVCSPALCFFVLLNRVSNEHLNMINEPYGHYALKSKIDALSKSAGVIRSTFSGDNVSASSSSFVQQHQHRVSLNSPRAHHRRGEKRRVRLSRTKRSGSTVIFTTQEPWV